MNVMSLPRRCMCENMPMPVRIERQRAAGGHRMGGGAGRNLEPRGGHLHVMQLLWTTSRGKRKPTDMRFFSGLPVVV